MLRPLFVFYNKACVATQNFLSSHVISSEPGRDLKSLSRPRKSPGLCKKCFIPIFLQLLVSFD